MPKEGATRKQLWVILFYIILSFSSDLLLVYDITTLPYVNLQLTIFVILETSIFIFYLILVANNKRLKHILTLILIFFILFCLLSVQWLESDKYYSTIASLETIIVIISCIIVFYEQITHPQTLFIYSTSSFWIIVSMLFYLSGTFFLSLVLPQLSEEETDRFWQLNLGFNILKNILFSIAFSIKKSSSENTLLNNNYNT